MCSSDLAGHEGRKEHGVLGPVVMVQHRGQQLGPPPGPVEVAEIAPSLHMGHLGPQSEMDTDESDNGAGHVRKHGGDAVGGQL